MDEIKLPENFEDAIADLPIDEQEAFYKYMAYGYEEQDGYDDEEIGKGELTFCKILVDYFDKEIETRNVNDFVVNKPQMDAFSKTLKFFSNYLKNEDGWIEPVIFEPRQGRVYLSVHTHALDLSLTSLDLFREILSSVSAFGADAESAGTVCIGFTFPDVFVEK